MSGVARVLGTGITWTRTSRRSETQAFGFTLIVTRADMGEWEWQAWNTGTLTAKGLADTRRQAGRAAVTFAREYTA